MVQKVNIVIVDDIDESEEATETVSFALDGTSYEIDLNDAHASDLRAALAPYKGSARKVPSGTAQGGKKLNRGASSADIRAWAIEKGYQIGDRGRIPADIQEAYLKAHRLRAV